MKKLLLLLAAVFWTLSLAPHMAQADEHITTKTPTENANIDEEGKLSELPVTVTIDVITTEEGMDEVEMPSSIHIINAKSGLDMVVTPGSGVSFTEEGFPGKAANAGVPDGVPATPGLPDNIPPTPQVEVPEITPPTMVNLPDAAIEHSKRP